MGLTANPARHVNVHSGKGLHLHRPRGGFYWQRRRGRERRATRYLEARGRRVLCFSGLLISGVVALLILALAS